LEPLLLAWRLVLRHVVCGPGWYYPGAVYPGFWYWNGWTGYQFAYETRPSLSGVIFDLRQIKKTSRKAVAEAGIYLSEPNGGNGCLGKAVAEAGIYLSGSGYLGTVESFSKKEPLPLRPGTYDLAIVLADGRTITMTVIVQPDRVTRVALRLDPPAAEPAATPNGRRDALAPAPSPTGGR
jgi:hypothetical protein